MEGQIAVNNLDIIDVINITERKQRRYLAILMNEVEEIWTSLGLTKDHPSFIQLRKSILDNTNELKRSWLRAIFPGDVEGTGII